MPTITLKAPWTYHTLPVTIEYQAGEHEVSDEIADAAKAAGVTTEQENSDGDANVPPAPRKARAADPRES
jgi:hypothetical protein